MSLIFLTYKEGINWNVTTIFPECYVPKIFLKSTFLMPASLWPILFMNRKISGLKQVKHGE
jgi:hypothetical protein